MVNLNIDFDFLAQSVALQESEHRRSITIVLMLGRFKRLGFDENRTPETDALFVLDNHAQKAAVLVELSAQIRIQQRVVTLTPSPEDEILATQPMCCFQTEPHLRRRPSKDLWVRAGRCAASITGMTK